MSAFFINANDIGNAVPNEKVQLFADDTNLFVFENSFAALSKIQLLY
jgi:hypothetical protein